MGAGTRNGRFTPQPVDALVQSPLSPLSNVEAVYGLYYPLVRGWPRPRGRQLQDHLLRRSRPIGIGGRLAACMRLASIALPRYTLRCPHLCAPRLTSHFFFEAVP